MRRWEIRAIRLRLDCRNPNPQKVENASPVGKTPETGAGPYDVMRMSASYSFGVLERCPVRVFKGMSGGLSRARTYITSERGIA